MSDDTAPVDAVEPGSVDPADGPALPLRVVADVVRAQCVAEGVRPPTLRTLRFWRDRGVLDAPEPLGFTRRHADQALVAARARAGGADMEGMRAAVNAAEDARSAAVGLSHGESSSMSIGQSESLASVSGSSIGSTGPGSSSLSGHGRVGGSMIWPGMPNPQPYPYPYPEPWVPVAPKVPSVTTTWLTAAVARPSDLERVAEALETGDAEGALEHLDAVIRAALRDPEADLGPLRELRARLEDLIAQHRRALLDLVGVIDELRTGDEDAPGEGAAGDGDRPAAVLSAGQPLSVADDGTVTYND